MMDWNEFQSSKQSFGPIIFLDRIFSKCLITLIGLLDSIQVNSFSR